MVLEGGYCQTEAGQRRMGGQETWKKGPGEGKIYQRWDGQSGCCSSCSSWWRRSQWICDTAILATPRATWDKVSASIFIAAFTSCECLKQEPESYKEECWRRASSRHHRCLTKHLEGKVEERLLTAALQEEMKTLQDDGLTPEQIPFFLQSRRSAMANSGWLMPSDA